MNRILIIFSLLLMLSIVETSHAAAVNVAKPEIKIATVAGFAGQSVKVDVTLINNGAPAATTFMLVIAYDETKLSAAPTAALGASANAAGKLLSTSVPPSGATRIKLLLQGGTAAVADGSLVSLTFPIKDVAGAATIPLAFHTPPDVVNAKGEPISVAATSGSIILTTTTQPPQKQM